LLAILIEKSNGNIQGVLTMMETLPLSKVRKIIDYWQELTLPMDLREKRVREAGDAAAQSVLDSIIEGKIEPKIDKDQTTTTNADPDSLSRFLGLGLDPAMLQPKINSSHKKEN
jgi:hypothetical protein